MGRFTAASRSARPSSMAWRTKSCSAQRGTARLRRRRRADRSNSAVTGALVRSCERGDKVRMRLASLAAPVHAAIGWALPPRCPGCGVPVEADHRFCGPCWSALRFLDTSGCARCGMPLAFDHQDGCCARCLAQPPRHDGVRAAVAYGPVAREIALRLKYGGRIGLAATVARPLSRLMPEEVELLVPVPLHRRRLWSRGYNQAALIADALSRATKVPVARQALTRRRATAVLRGQSPAKRRRTLAGAFAVPDRTAVTGRAVALVDDVYTSGATADACTRALLGAGARRVVVLCWARVLDGDD
jgi:ComF family protein